MRLPEGATHIMHITRAFKHGNAQAVLIPAALAYDCTDLDLEIERVGDELRIRPVRRSLAGVLEKFASVRSDGREEDRSDHQQTERENL